VFSGAPPRALLCALNAISACRMLSLLAECLLC